MASGCGRLLRKLPEPVAARGDYRSRSTEGALSPVSPLERNPRSPKGWKKRESDGVGLGIVASLERTSSGEKSPRVVAGTATAPIAIGSLRVRGGRRSRTFEAGDLGCSAGERAALGSGDARRKGTGFRCGESTATTAEEYENFGFAEFLNCCYLCRKRLHGKDIFMYRGEKAFCSAECRYQQMVSDEYQEKCGLGVRSTPEISSSPYSGTGRLFFAGIVVS